MSGSGSGESPFNIEAYIFNGHGATAGGKTFTLPPNAYYITGVECGEIAYIDSSQILQSFRWRNKGFDTVPKLPKPDSEEDKTKLQKFREELATLLGADVNKLLISFPGDEVDDNYFTPISISEIRGKGRIMDGASGVISRQKWLNVPRNEISELKQRHYLPGSKFTQQEQTGEGGYNIVGPAKSIDTYYKASYWPTQDDVKIIMDSNKGDLNKTITALKGEENTRLVSDLVKEISNLHEDKPVVFYNPLCRVLPSTSEQQKQRAQDQNLEETEKRYEQLNPELTPSSSTSSSESEEEETADTSQIVTRGKEEEEKKLQKLDALEEKLKEKGVTVDSLSRSSSESSGYSGSTDSEDETPSLTPSSSGETTSSSDSDSTYKGESEEEGKKNGGKKKTRSQKLGGRRRTYRRQAVPKRKTYRNKKLKRQTRKRR